MLMRQYPTKIPSRQRAVKRDPPVYDPFPMLKEHEHLIQELKSGNCVVFLGSGFAIPAGGPNWVDLLLKVAARAEKEMAQVVPSGLYDTVKKLTEDWDASKLEQAAQLLEDVLGKKKMNKLTADEVQRPRNEKDKNHFPVKAETIEKHKGNSLM